MLRIRIFSLVLASLSLAAPTQAAVLTAVGGLQGAAVFAKSSIDPHSVNATGLGLVPTGGATLPVKLNTRAIPKPAESDSQLYAMIGLGLIGLMLMRRKRYGRN